VSVRGGRGTGLLEIKEIYEAVLKNKKIIRGEARCSQFLSKRHHERFWTIIKRRLWLRTRRPGRPLLSEFFLFSENRSVAFAH